MIKDMFKKLPEATKSGPATRWYIQILPGGDYEDDHGHLDEAGIPAIESRWFDTRDEAIAWSESITYKDYHVVGRSMLCHVEGLYTAGGVWTYTDPIIEEYL